MTLEEYLHIWYNERQSDPVEERKKYFMAQRPPPPLVNTFAQSDGTLAYRQGYLKEILRKADPEQMRVAFGREPLSSVTRFLLKGNFIATVANPNDLRGIWIPLRYVQQYFLYYNLPVPEEFQVPIDRPLFGRPAAS
jgi:hypothetical protein